jgi:hypothetical protein
MRSLISILFLWVTAIVLHAQRTPRVVDSLSVLPTLVPSASQPDVIVSDGTNGFRLFRYLPSNSENTNTTEVIGTSTGTGRWKRLPLLGQTNSIQFASSESALSGTDPVNGYFARVFTGTASSDWSWSATEGGPDVTGERIRPTNYVTGSWIKGTAWATSKSFSGSKAGAFDSSGAVVPATGTDGEKTSIGLGNVSAGYNRLPYFYDDFSRPDTSAGSIGLPPMGTTYDLRRAGAVLSANQTRVASKKWVSDAGDIVYGVQRLPGQISRIGATFRFTSGTGGASGEAVLALLVFPDATGANMIRDMGVHVTITRTNYQVQVRTNNASFTLAGGAGSFPSPLSFDTTYTADVLVSGNYMTCNLAGVSVQCNDSRVAQYSGNYAGWEHFYTSSPSAQLLVIESVWADSAPYSTTSGQQVDGSFKATAGALSYYLGENLLAGISANTHNLYGGSAGFVVHDSSANALFGAYSTYISSSKEHYFLDGVRLGNSFFANNSSGVNNLFGDTNGLSFSDSTGVQIALGTSTYFSFAQPLVLNGGLSLGTNLLATNVSSVSKLVGGPAGLALTGVDGVNRLFIHTNYVSLDATTYLNQNVYLRTNVFLIESSGANNVYGGPSGFNIYDSTGSIAQTVTSASVTIEKPFYVNDPVALGANGIQFTRVRRGTATLTAGSVTVADATVTANSEIYLNHRTPGGTPGWLRVSSRSNGVSFTVTSSSGTDTSVIGYWMVEP